MHISLYTAITIVVAILLPWGVYKAVDRLTGGLGELAFPVGLVIAFICSGLAVGFGYGLISYSPSNQVAVFSQNGELKRIVPRGRVLFVWDRQALDGVTVFLDPRAVSLDSTVRFVVSANRIREIRYRVSIKMSIDPVKRFQLVSKFPDNVLNDAPGDHFRGLNRFLQSQLNQFNERAAAELATFYDDASDVQQRRFANLVRSELSPALEEYGLQVTDVDFDFPKADPRLVAKN